MKKLIFLLIFTLFFELFFSGCGCPKKQVSPAPMPTTEVAPPPVALEPPPPFEPNKIVESNWLTLEQSDLEYGQIAKDFQAAYVVEQQQVESIPLSVPLFWNTWAEDAEYTDWGEFKPVTTSLIPGHNYRLALDLGAVEYQKGNQEISNGIKKILAESLQTKKKALKLKVILLVDSSKFEVSNNKYVRDFYVNLARLRKDCKNGLLPEENGDFFNLLNKAMTEGKEPDFSFGGQEPDCEGKKTFGGIFFDVKTTKSEGPAGAVFLIWDDNRPLDEVSVKFCIEKSQGDKENKCGDLKQITFPQGLNCLEVASEEGEPPKASLNIVGFEEIGGIKGVFRNNCWPKDQFMVWDLAKNKNVKEIFEKLWDPIIKDLEQMRFDENLLGSGEALFNNLFPPEATDFISGANVQEEILNFLRPYILVKDLNPNYRPPSIFIRMIPHSNPLPLGLVAVKLNKCNDNKITKDNGRFLGEYFLIYAPLEIQTYKPPDNCLSDWVMLLPPKKDFQDPKKDDPEIQDLQALNPDEYKKAAGQFRAWDEPCFKLQDAIINLSPRIEEWKKNCNVTLFTKMCDFRAWMTDSVIERPVVLVTLSHHEQDRLFFHNLDLIGDQPFYADLNMVHRYFVQPSVAILIGCGTGGEEAEKIINTFNKDGFLTIIATSTAMDSKLGGAFLSVLAEEIKNSAQTTIGLAYWNTLNQLSKMSPKLNPGEVAKGFTPSPFGANVHKFMLLGNPDVIVSPPKSASPPQSSEENGDSQAEIRSSSGGVP